MNQHKESLIGGTSFSRRSLEVIFAEEDSFQCLERLRRFCVETKLAVALCEHFRSELALRFRAFGEKKTSSQLVLLKSLFQYVHRTYLDPVGPTRDVDTRLWVRACIMAMYRLVMSSQMDKLVMSDSFRLDFFVLVEHVVCAMLSLYLSSRLKYSKLFGLGTRV